MTSLTREHGGASRKDGVGVQVLTDVDIALHDGVVGGLMDTSGFHSQERRLEESFRATESLVSDGDDLKLFRVVLFEEFVNKHLRLNKLEYNTN